MYSNINDSLIITMMQVSLELRCSRISWVLILYFHFGPCCLREVARRMMIGYNLRDSKIIEQSMEDSPLLIEEGYPRPLVEIITRNL